MLPENQPIGMLDSGVGGISTLREVRKLLPGEDILYFADQDHVPYGPRSREEIQCFVHGITEFFLVHNVKAVVLACNAASAAALAYIRKVFPGVPFVGMEPAVKPAAERTTSGVIGVITTKATYQGELFASVVERYANGVRVETQVCPDFVTLVEAGHFDSREVRRTAELYLDPLIKAGIDQLVLGCTHFPFLVPVIQEIVGPDVRIIDPNPAIAQQLKRVIMNDLNPGGQGQTTFFTSGEISSFQHLVMTLLDEPVESDAIFHVDWHDAQHLNLSDVPATNRKR